MFYNWKKNIRRGFGLLLIIYEELSTPVHLIYVYYDIIRETLIN